MKENDGTWCVDCGHPTTEHEDKSWGCTNKSENGPWFTCVCRLTPQGVRDASDAAANEAWE